MLPEFAQSLYDRFDREGIPLLLAEHPIEEARLRALCQRYGGPAAFDMIRTS